ncbi:MAG: hypothetical protein ACOCVM_00860 [Desulfovibrionaceae bacterium]
MSGSGVLLFNETLFVILGACLGSSWQAMEGMTQDRSDVLRGIRTRYLQEEGLGRESRLAMLRLFNSFDRMVRLLRQLFQAQRCILEMNGVPASAQGPEAVASEEAGAPAKTHLV